MKKVYNLPLYTDAANSRQVNEPSFDSKAWNICYGTAPKTPLHVSTSLATGMKQFIYFLIPVS